VLEKPTDLSDDQLRGCLQADYGLALAQLAFLPLGADVNTAVYRAVDVAGAPYFVKARRGAFDAALALVPQLLRERGVAHVIAPLPNRAGALWTQLAGFTVTLSPFVEGKDGVERPLTDAQWVAFGATLRTLHSLELPDELRAGLPNETYAPVWRDMVRMFQARAEAERFDEPVAGRLAELLRAKRAVVSALVERAEQLADALAARAPQQLLCHADIHAFNVLTDAEGAFYVVDWDTLMLAPKERDLMFVGGGIGGVWNTAREEALFYQGYGPTEIDQEALAYYRYERIAEDIASYCEQLLLSDAGGADRAQSLRFVASNFLPGSVLEIAERSDPDRRPASHEHEPAGG
jgi:spectinomycin phosphotransferase